MLVPVTLSDFERWDTNGQLYWRISINNYARMVWARMTEISKLRQVWKKHVSRGTSCPSQVGGAPTSLEFSGPRINAQTVWSSATKFGTGMLTYVGEQRVSMGLPRPHPKRRRVFLGGQTRPRLKGWSLQRPGNFWELLRARTQYQKQPNFARWPN